MTQAVREVLAENPRGLSPKQLREQLASLPNFKEKLNKPGLVAGMVRSLITNREIELVGGKIVPGPAGRR